MKNTIASILCWTGMLLILAGVFMPLFTGPADTSFKYVFCVGAALNLIGRLMTGYDGGNIRVKRLLRIEVWASLFFGAAGYFMFTDPDPKNWIVFVLAAGVLYVYTSIMIPVVQKRASKK